MLSRRFVVIVITLCILTTSGIVRGDPVRPAAGPAPDLTYRAPYDVNTQANTVPLFDGAGGAVLVGRASSGPYSGSVIVFRPDGSCVICDIDARGAASISEADGYDLVVSVDEDKRTIRVWRLDERYGVAQRPVLERAARLPVVITEE